MEIKTTQDVVWVELIVVTYVLVDKNPGAEYSSTSMKLTITNHQGCSVHVGGTDCCSSYVPVDKNPGAE